MSRLKTLPPRIREVRPRTAAPAPTAYGQGRGGRPWRRKRDAVLKRDGYLCQCEQCQDGTRLPKVADEVDHITPVMQGGTDDDTNLRAINSDCHKLKTAREARHMRGVG